MKALNFEMLKANLLAENIYEFINFTQKSYENKNNIHPNKDKIYQIKLLIQEFRFQIIADELHRINQYSWEPKYTHYLVDQFQEGINVIEEYVKNNYNDLFLFTARIYTLQNLIQSFTRL